MDEYSRLVYVTPGALLFGDVFEWDVFQLDAYNYWCLAHYDVMMTMMKIVMLFSSLLDNDVIA